MTRLHAALRAIGGGDLDNATHTQHELPSGCDVPVLRRACLQQSEHGALDVANAIRGQIRLQPLPAVLGRREDQYFVGEVRDAVRPRVEPNVRQLVDALRHGGLIGRRRIGRRRGGAEGEEWHDGGHRHTHSGT